MTAVSSTGCINDVTVQGSLFKVQGIKRGEFFESDP
jgi:hypothetical protein